MSLDIIGASVREIDQLLTVAAGELDAGIEPGDVEADVMAGRAEIERRPYGVAIIQFNPHPHLWLLYLLPGHRGKGLGRAFVRELIHKHEHSHFMTVTCSGAARRRFFGRLGFRVESRSGDYRSMTRSDYIHR
jgi:GNAT superfamily N-acetyltransferase